jgi:glyoxylase-like metal-dependent hydrolase (beta-lactamase superfamily II)
MLEKASRTTPELPCDKFVSYLQGEFPAEAQNLEFIRFHRCEFESKGGTWPMRFAICFISPNFSARQRLFEEAQRITNATGWYPLVMGHRMKASRSVDPPSRVAGLEKARLLVNRRFGKFLSLRALTQSTAKSAAGAPKPGCGFVLQFEHSSVLLDFNFSYEPSGQLAATPDFGILTHTHQDHSGGVRGALDSGVPVILSESVCQQLKVLQPWFESHNHSTIPIPPRVALSSKVDGTTFQFTPGAHSPGAMMVSVTSSNGDRLVYPGDYSLRNRYYNESPDQLSSMFEGVTGRKFLLVDGTFLKHGPALPAITHDVEHTLSDLHSGKRDALFTAESSDYLFAAYMWHFQKFYTGPKERLDRYLVVHRSLLTLIETTFEAFIRRQHEQYDPFLKAMLGTTMSNYLESVRLYPFSGSVWPSDLDGPVDVFCPLTVAGTALLNMTNPYAMVLGRTRGNALGELNGVDALSLDGPDFSFHSAAEDVGQIVRAAVAAGVRPIIFHNFENRIRKAMTTQGIASGEYSIAGTTPVSFSSPDGEKATS